MGNSLLNSPAPRTPPDKTLKSANVLLKKKAKLKLLLPTLSKLVVTTLTFSVNNTKKNKKPRLNSNVLFLRLMPKSLNGATSTKPMLSNVPKNLKRLRRNSVPSSKIWKKLLKPPTLNVLLLRRLKLANKENSKIFKSISNDPTLLHLLLIRSNVTSTRCSLNTNKKKKSSKLNLKVPRKNLALFQPNSSKLRTLTKKLLMDLRPSNV